MNDIFLLAMGYDESDHKQLVGKHHSIFVSYEYSKSDDYKKFWEKLKSGDFFEGEFERKKMDGSPIYLQATYNPIINESNVITKVMKIATDITETVVSKNKIDALSKDLQLELDKSQELKNSIEKEKDNALNDLDVMIKKSQSELIKTIVKVALSVIVGVGVVTTILYWMAIITNRDTQIIGSTWSNMFSVLLTNAFSIVGTIMGIKYATQENNNKQK
jgi:PAS domain S-box-containing protein